MRSITDSRLSEYEAYSGYDPDRLVREHLGLVKRIAQQLVAKLPSHIDIDDLIQVGLIGLLKAAEDYQRESGAIFSTYATIRIRGAMLDELRTRDWLPRSVQRDLGRVARAIEQAEQTLGRAPTDADIAQMLDMPLADYQVLAGELAVARVTALEDSDDAVGGDEPMLALTEFGQREALIEAIKTLPEKEALMLSLYYSEGLNLKEIGLVLGVSESRVSQLHGQAVARLRAKLTDWR